MSLRTVFLSVVALGARRQFQIMATFHQSKTYSSSTICWLLPVATAHLSVSCRVRRTLMVAISGLSTITSLLSSFQLVVAMAPTRVLTMVFEATSGAAMFGTKLASH